MGQCIPLPDIESLPPEVKDVVKMFPLNVILMMANAPASIKGLVEFANSILFQSQFDPRKREIAILRVAHVTHALYEWTQHIELARLFGVTEQEIEIIQFEEPVTSLDQEGNLLCRVADEISRDVRLSDEALGLILERYGVRQATELILCVSYFNFVSRFLESTRVEIEDQAAWDRLKNIK
jgi:4-carboxymuconolactone decarboxylase